MDVTKTWLPVEGEKYAEVATRVRCKLLNFDFMFFTFRMSQKATDLRTKGQDSQKKILLHWDELTGPVI